VVGRSARTASGYSPPRVTPVDSLAQSRVDGELVQAETNRALNASAGGSLPAAADSAAYPSVPVADRNDPTAYATAFIAELLDRDYRDQSRTQLLAWVQAESAPNTLPGVPASLAPRSLVWSLTTPEGAGDPVPSTGRWTTLAESGASQTVVGLQTEVDPDWLTLISTGWEPVDPAMTMLTVTGTITISDTAGQTSQQLLLVLTLGSNGSRPGYGAVALDDWTVG
jgi:hypothetical protein